MPTQRDTCGNQSLNKGKMWNMWTLQFSPLHLIYYSLLHSSLVTGWDCFPTVQVMDPDKLKNLP